MSVKIQAFFKNNRGFIEIKNIYTEPRGGVGHNFGWVTILEGIV